VYDIITANLHLFFPKAEEAQMGDQSMRLKIFGKRSQGVKHRPICAAATCIRL
jgi:hypothetical protein